MDMKAVNNNENSAQAAEKDMTGAVRLPYRVRLLADSVPLYTGAGTEYVSLGSISDDYYDLEIAEERMGKGQKLWGRLRSDAGWILLEHTEKITI